MLFRWAWNVLRYISTRPTHGPGSQDNVGATYGQGICSACVQYTQHRTLEWCRIARWFPGKKRKKEKKRAFAQHTQALLKYAPRLPAYLRSLSISRREPAVSIMVPPYPTNGIAVPVSKGWGGETTEEKTSTPSFATQRIVKAIIIFEFDHIFETVGK